MQVTETLADGLKRELKVVIGQGELGERFAARLGEVKDTVQLKGFRKGKVPAAHLKKLYGRSVMAEVLQAMIDETSRQAISERNERPAQQPSINLSEDKEEIERVLTGQSDLAFTMSYETLPKFAITDLSALKLEREVAEVAEEAINKAIEELVQRAIRFEVEVERAAGEGDRVSIDFVGSIDGQEFEGGKGEGVELVIGEFELHPGLRRGHRRRQVRGGALDQRQIPRALSRGIPCRQGCRLRRPGEGGRQTHQTRRRRRLCQDAGR